MKIQMMNKEEDCEMLEEGIISLRNEFDKLHKYYITSSVSKGHHLKNKFLPIKLRLHANMMKSLNHLKEKSS